MRKESLEEGRNQWERGRKSWKRAETAGEENRKRLKTGPKLKKNQMRRET